MGRIRLQARKGDFGRSYDRVQPVWKYSKLGNKMVFVLGPPLRGEWRPGYSLAVADDGDEIVAFGPFAAARTAVRNGAGDVVTVDFAVARGLGKLMRLAIGVGRRRAAFVAGRQATVDAIAVGIVGDDEHLSVRLRARSTKAKDGNETQKTAEENCPHETPNPKQNALPSAEVKCDQIINAE